MSHSDAFDGIYNGEYWGVIGFGKNFTSYLTKRWADQMLVSWFKVLCVICSRSLFYVPSPALSVAYLHRCVYVAVRTDDMAAFWLLFLLHAEWLVNDVIIITVPDVQMTWRRYAENLNLHLLVPFCFCLYSSLLLNVINRCSDDVPDVTGWCSGRFPERWLMEDQFTSGWTSRVRFIRVLVLVFTEMGQFHYNCIEQLSLQRMAINSSVQFKEVYNWSDVLACGCAFCGFNWI